MNSFGIFASAFAAITVALTTMGCEPPSTSDGERGVLTFNYTTSRCVLGCGLDHAILQGSKITVEANGGSPGMRPTIVDGAMFAINWQSESYSCVKKDNSSRSIGKDEPCAPGEERKASLSMELEAKNAGETKLMIDSASGSFLDAIKLRVQPAVRIDVEVRANGRTLSPSDGVYTVHEHSEIEVTSTPRSESGDELVFTKSGLTQDYSDRNVIFAHDDSLSSNTQDMTAGHAGEATVTLRAQGATLPLRFRVTP